MPQNLIRPAIYSVALVKKVPMVDIAKILFSIIYHCYYFKGIYKCFKRKLTLLGLIPLPCTMQVFPRALKPQSERHRQSPSIINYIALNHNSPTLVTKELILSKTSTKFLCIWVFACRYICVTCTCLVPTEAGRGWWILELTDGC